MFYVSKDNEVSTWKLLEYSLLHGKKICVPKVDPVRHLIHPLRIKYPDRELVKGYFGIHEPVYKKRNLIPLKEIDLIIVPGIAFDTYGYRLGWGKGYYDKFLRNADGIHKIGLAFELQILSQLPRDKHDIPIDMIVTERRIVKMQPQPQIT